jgi:hypothetical protein
VLAFLGGGCDHTLGERAVAMLVADLAPGPNGNAALVTDRRLLARADDLFADVPFDALARMDAKRGIVYDDLWLHTRERAYKLVGLQDQGPLVAFLQGLCAVDPAWRVPPALPLVTPTEGDPSGAGYLRATACAGDPRVGALASVLEGACARSIVTVAQARDLAARVSLLDRTLAYGRGARGGWWQSPLAPPDLSLTLGRVLGPPVQVQDVGGARVLRFRLGGGGNVAGAAASTAVGLLALGVLGIGWVSTPGRSARDIDAHLLPAEASTSFGLLEGRDPLSRQGPELLEAVLERLPGLEARALLLRCAYGWEAPLEFLETIPSGAVQGRLREAFEGVDLAPFMSM